MSDQQDPKDLKPFKRFIGKIQKKQGQFGTFLKLMIDNPLPTKVDKESGEEVADEYHKGMLIWLDAETGKKYLVKQLAIHGVAKAASAHGFINSVAIDLEDEYHVTDLG